MSRLASALVVASLLSTALAAADYDPFQVPRPVFQERVRSLAMQPFVLPRALAERDDLRREIEARITAKLESFGYSVVGSDTVRSIWRDLSGKLGGVHDPFTGEVDEERRALAWDYLFHELELRGPVDAVVVGSVRLDFMHPFRGEHDWEMPPGYPLIWGAAELGGSALEHPLAMVGPQLGIYLFDRERAVLYDIMVPIEWSSLFHMSSRVTRPDDELLRTPAHVQRAVDIVLGPLDPVKIRSQPDEAGLE